MKIFLWFSLCLLNVGVAVWFSLRTSGEQWQMFVLGWFASWALARAMIEARKAVQP